MQKHFRKLSMLLILAAPVLPVLRGQTQIDLRSQSRNVDFSKAQSVRPFKTGSALPATCTAGEMFFKTSAPAGANTYGCVATNAWALQGDGAASGGGSASPDFTVELNTDTNSLTVACPPGLDCNVQSGDTVTRYMGLRSVFGPRTGNYTALVYFDNQGLRYGYPAGELMNSCSGFCVPGVTQFPTGSAPLFSVVVSGGVLQDGTLRDLRTRLRASKKVLQGSNIVVSETADSITLSTPSTLRNQPQGTKPACASATRGTFWHTNAGAGAKDSVEVCAKDEGDNYAWRAIY